MARNSTKRKDNITAAWTPDLFGPIFKEDGLTLKEALNLRNVDEQIHLMATFLPDEIIYGTDLPEQCFRNFRAVLLLLNISGFSTLFKEYIYNENGASMALTKILNNYIHIVVHEIYCSDGDILKFSAEGLLAAWKVRDGEFIFDTVKSVIVRALCIQNSIASLEDGGWISNVSIVISAGDVTFSVIGSDEARHFVIFGPPIGELKHAKRVALPNDLVLSSSAWQHCTPSQYEYVIKDSYNIKVIKVLQQSDAKSTYAASASPGFRISSDQATSAERKFTTDPVKPSPSYRTNAIYTGQEPYSETVIANRKEKALTAISAITTVNPNFGTYLRSYLMKPVIRQIEQDQLLEFLTEIRRVTTVYLDIIPNKCPDDELIPLVDKCFLLLHSIATRYAGCINTANLYDRNILFSVVFGIRECDGANQSKIDETCKNGIVCATQILRAVRSIGEIQGTFVGVSTGMAYCGVVGHAARKYYAIIGPSVDKAMGIMDISYDKISCDYDTLLYSRVSKDQFRSRGVRTLRRSGKHHVYEYLSDRPKRKDLDVTSSLDYCYPILGRLQELEDFDEVLNEIGMAGRNYSGLLIEGGERSGKSRLLDAFVTRACNRRIRAIKLSLHVTYAEKVYAVIHHVILQILEAEDCNTVEEREKILLARLGDVLELEDFCYLNTLMRVRFPLSDTYCSDSDWRRHTKTITIFETILKQLKTKICILLDDIQHIDYMSWQFLSMALDDDNVVVATTMLKSTSWDNLSHVEVEICKDKRLMKRTLLDLDSNLLPAFACQFLNALAIPRRLSRLLRKRKDGHIGWCEAFLTLILQSDGLNLVRISPSEARQYDIVFPDGSLVTKLPVELMPEELAPPLPWSQMSYLDVCVTNKPYYKISDINLDMNGLIGEIYNRMNPYEQSFITCAATLGTVFKRSVLQNVMPSAILPHVTKIVTEMIRMRILECASLQRRDFHSEDLALCILKKRRTFSDMHHLVSCDCHLSRSVVGRPSSLYAHCKTLEFKVDLFRKTIYGMQSDNEMRENHTKAARIYGQNARKCGSCGGGTFLRVPSKEIKEESRTESPRISLIRRRTIVEDRNDRSPIARRSILSVGEMPSVRKQESTVRRISIMPTYLDGEEDEVSRNEEVRESLTDESSRYWRRLTSVAPETREPSQRSCLEEFSHIDYRNCQCDGIISCLFWRLHQHIENSEETNKMLDFLTEYSAGLIQTAQPSYATKLLSIATERNEAAKMSEWTLDNAEDNITNKGIILALTGDAYSALGNYAQAKKCYTEAVLLRSTPSRMNRAICYNMIASKLYCKLQGFPHYRSHNEISGQLAVRKLELASYTGRLCAALMIEDKLKAAKLFALNSINLGFPVVDGFLVKGEIYLAAVRVLHRARNIELMRCVERSMLTAIKTKISWDDAEEMAMVANIYFVMYQIRALRGELEEAVSMGVKVLRISGTLHLSNLTLVTMPSLIQVMLWTKRINEAVDLMRELYFLAEDDVDSSAKTWYYALCLELALDAGVIQESYETCLNYYRTCIANSSKSCVARDPQGLCRLLTCLWIYQLRMGYTVTNLNTRIYSAETYTRDVSFHDFSRIFSCSKGLECYLLILLRCVNMKHSNELLDLIQDVCKITKCLNNVSGHARVVKPRLYLLMAYLNVIRGRKSAARFYLYRAQKFAASQGNKMIAAWIIQNRRTWIKKIYNNMAQYWLENIGSPDLVAWQYIDNFNIDIWSTILYPLPIPDSYL